MPAGWATMRAVTLHRPIALLRHELQLLRDIALKQSTFNASPVGVGPFDLLQAVPQTTSQDDGAG